MIFCVEILQNNNQMPIKKMNEMITKKWEETINQKSKIFDTENIRSRLRLYYIPTVLNCQGDH